MATATDRSILCHTLLLIPTASAGRDPNKPNTRPMNLQWAHIDNRDSVFGRSHGRDNYPMLRSSASGPEIWLVGRTAGELILSFTRLESCRNHPWEPDFRLGKSIE